MIWICVDLVSAYRGKPAYRLADTVTSINLGLFQQLLALSYKRLTILPYIYIYEHYRIITVDVRSPITFIGLMLGCDLVNENYSNYHIWQ